jgi:hypothetical protein
MWRCQSRAHNSVFNCSLMTHSVRESIVIWLPRMADVVNVTLRCTVVLNTTCMRTIQRTATQASFEYVGTTVKWIGERGSAEERGVDAADESKVLVRVDPSYFRPTEVELLIGKRRTLLALHCLSQ